MPSVTRTSGLTITTPETYTVDAGGAAPETRRTRGRGPGRVRGPIPMPSEASGTSGGAAENRALLAALASQDFALIDEIDLRPALEPTARDGIRRSTSPTIPLTQEAQLDVPLDADEDAVLLVEQDGVFAWTLPTHTDTVAAPARRSRRAAPTSRVAHFAIEIHATRETGGPATRGLLSTVVYDQLKVYALKFAARVAVGSGVRFLERHVRRGLIRVTGTDPTAWALAAPASIPLPSHRQARILLLVHGTFSSTIGSFGPLCGTPWGRAFLQAVAADYDAVLGFDHATLSEDPMANATDLLAALEALPAAVPPRIDAVAFSRGGLVFRTLVEHLLPQAPGTCRVERGVFVACTNGGTLLARPENWQTLIDIYTNLAVAAFRLLTLLPQTAAAALILQEVVSGLGAFVKYLATSASGDVPGLAAMQPEGPFVQTLNSYQEGQPAPGDTLYYAVTSAFAPRIDGNGHLPRELPFRLVMALADGLIEQVMGEPGDLVVNTRSMTAIDESTGVYIRDAFAFGATPTVYHTSYFTHPDVVKSLTRWLDLASGRETMLEPLSAPRELEVPAIVDTDIAIADALAPAGDAAAIIDAQSPSYLVVSRPHEGEILYYAFTPEEVLPGATARPDDPLIDVLNLHEWQRSPERPVGDLAHVDVSGAPARHAARVVAMVDDTPIGVVPEPGASGEADIVELSRMAANPGTSLERARARRAMPTFSSGTARASQTRAVPPAAPAAGVSRPFAGSAPPPIPAAASVPAPSAQPPRPTRRGMVRRGGVQPLETSQPPATAAPAAVATPAPAEQVECHFLAEMDPEVLLNHTATIEVTVSREQLAALEGRLAAGASGRVNVSTTLLVQVLPKSNFTLADPAQDRIEVEPPSPDAPLSLYFDVKAAHPGPGEVWIIVRQHQMGVARLVLEPTVVERASVGRRRPLAASADAVPAPPLAQPLDQLSIFEQTIGDTVQYRFELELPSLNVFCLHDSPPLRSRRDEYVQNLYKEIEDRYVSTFDAAAQQADVAAFTAELQSYGAILFDQLFPLEIQQLLWTHRDRLRSVRVVSTEPFIPWEIVHLRAPGQGLDIDAPPRFLGQMGLTRWLHNVNGLPPASLRIRQGRARYVIPDYPHPQWKLPMTAEERRYLEEAFQATAIEPQPNPLKAALATPGAFDLLHVACHGEAESDKISHARLVLQGRVEGANFVPTHMPASTVETFARLRGPDGVQPIVFLNACQAGRAGYQLTGIGGFAQAFLKAGAGAFVGTLWSVEDQPAFHFGKAFYDALRAGDSISEAAIKAREASRQTDATWLAYVVYGHPHGRLG
jgi:hypothetical protein